MFTGVFEVGVKMAKIDWEAAVLPLNYARGRFGSADLAETARSAKRVGDIPGHP